MTAHPHVCPSCGSPAFIGFSSIECSRVGCERGPKGYVAVARAITDTTPREPAQNLADSFFSWLVVFVAKDPTPRTQIEYTNLWAHEAGVVIWSYDLDPFIEGWKKFCPGPFSFHQRGDKEAWLATVKRDGYEALLAKVRGR